MAEVPLQSEPQDPSCSPPVSGAIDEDEERKSFGRIAHALREYYADAEWDIHRWEFNYSRLSTAHKAYLPELPAKFAAVRECIYTNQFFIKTLLSVFDEDLGAPSHLSAASSAAAEYAETVGNKVHPQDVEKVRYLLKNLMRDWSQEGASEREQSYGRIVQEIENLFADRQRELLSKEDQQQPGLEGSSPVSVLVPGAGLGRLCLELSSRGFAAQGNEFSYYMLITSSFMLNCSSESEQWTIYPWALTSVNQLSDADQIRPVRVPDVVPCDLVPGPGLMSMCAGDFAEVYSKEEYRGSFDCVATCFFIDTAHNVIDYLKVMYDVLKPGGYWVNLGPLLYHWADSHTYLPQPELSIELSLQDVERIAAQIGFKLLRKSMVPCNYMTNKRSMLRNGYECVFQTWQKQGAQSS